MFASMLLDSMAFEITDLNSLPNQSHNSEPEEAKIKFVIVCHQRHIIDVEGVKMPMSISLIGNHERYFGIKAVVYNRLKRKEDGVFFRVSGNLIIGWMCSMEFYS